MKGPLRVVAVSGGLSRPSKSAALAAHLLEGIAQRVSCNTQLIELSELAPQLMGSIWRSDLPRSVEHAFAAVEQADVLVVSTPVFRGSYSGLFKHFFDFIHQDALIDKPVFLAATGGTERHTLMIDHQLRPLFSFFQARTCPLGVYATDSDFVDYFPKDEALLQRAALAVEKGLPLIQLALSTTEKAREQEVMVA